MISGEIWSDTSPTDPALAAALAEQSTHAVVSRTMKEAVFISYRRDDSGPEALLLAKALREVLGERSVFLDTSSMDLGAEWPERIRSALQGARYVLVVVGPDWLRVGSDEWGQRRIDQETDWVRQELADALRDGQKTIIPVLIRGGKIPPASVLPDALAGISRKQAIELRRDYWDHDVKLLTAQVRPDDDAGERSDRSTSPYPHNAPLGPDPFSDDKLDAILKGELKAWRKVVSPLPEDHSKVRVELQREYLFSSFQEAIRFMAQVAPGCDIANHHPRWENLWKTIRVYLTTWDIGHRISDRDVQLARYFDRAYSEFAGAAKRKAV